MKAWIARDPDGICFVYTEKPTFCKGEEDGEYFGYWESESAALFETGMPETFHPEVTFENSPMQIALTPDDGIAILKRKVDNLEAHYGNKKVLFMDFAMLTGKMYVINHTLDMLELLKGGN